MKKLAIVALALFGASLFAGCGSCCPKPPKPPKCNTCQKAPVCNTCAPAPVVAPCNTCDK